MGKVVVHCATLNSKNAIVSTNSFLAHHFDITGGRRNPELRGPDGKLGSLDPRTKVIEFRTCGVKVKSTKKFYVLNPTNLSYEFSWECEESSKLGFHCINKKGLIAAGKKFEMVFECTPMELGLKESFWIFKIPEHKLEIPFVLVCTAEEPEVYFEKTHVNFNSLLVSRKAQETVCIWKNGGRTSQRNE